MKITLLVTLLFGLDFFNRRRRCREDINPATTAYDELQSAGDGAGVKRGMRVRPT